MRTYTSFLKEQEDKDFRAVCKRWTADIYNIGRPCAAG